MKKGHFLVIGVALGALLGWAAERHVVHWAVFTGPYSDNYGSALAAVEAARAKLQSGDTNLLGELKKAEEQIRQAQRWTREFLGEPDGAANRSQPIRAETNSASAAAGSGG